MTEPSDKPEVEEAAPSNKRRMAPRTAVRARSFWRSIRPHSPLGWLVEALVVLLLAAGVGLAVLRFAPLTTEVRLLLETQLNGFQLGPLGKLKVKGVHGDIFTRFSVDQWSISDEKGVWIEADKSVIRWRPGELLFSRLHVQNLEIGKIIVFRQPVLSRAPPAAKGGAFSLQFDAVKARLQLEPAFAQTRAVYDLGGRFDQEAKGRTIAKVAMASVLRPGDYLNADLDLSFSNALKLDIEARETRGGGIAGGLGLGVDQPFLLSAHVSGPIDARKLNVVARSGANTPLTLQGGWNPQGGRFIGHVSLLQSRWTKDWANPFGSEAQIELGAHNVDKNTVVLDIGLKSDNLLLGVHGPADPGKRTTKGLAVNLTVNNLAKLVPQPVMGKGQIVGALSGSIADLKLAGQAQVADFNFIDWRLARVAGPVSLAFHNRQMTIQASVAGSGGSGTNLMAAAGGPSPTGKIELDVLPEGRLLIRSMSIVGKGVKVQGEGGQNLIGGGLTFKGQMLVPDMATVRKGGAGSFEGNWSAVQTTQPGYPWTFTVEGHGDKLASGSQDFDALMGTEPHFAASAGFVGDTVTFDKVELRGARAQANMQGAWKVDGSIKFGLNWQAAGPFSIGPLDVAGKAAGQGELTGLIWQPKLDLQSELETVNLPSLTLRQAKLGLTFNQRADGSDGHIGLTGQSDYGQARMASDFRFEPHGLELTGVDMDAGGVRAKGALALMDQGLSTADLTVDVAPGAVLTDGQVHGRVSIVGGQGAANADLQLDAKGAIFRGQAVALGSAKLTAKGPVSHLPYQVQADGAVAHAPLKLTGSGVFAADAHGYQVDFQGSGQLRRQDFHTLEAARLRMADDQQSAHLNLSLGGGSAVFDGQETGGAAQVKARFTGVDLAFLSEDFTGRFDADLEMEGKGKDLHGALQAAVKDAHSRDAKAGLSLGGDLNAVLANNHLTVRSELLGGQGLKASTNFVLPVDAGAAPLHLAVVRDKPMSAHFDADGEIQPLWDLFLGGERSLGGLLVAKFDVTGTVADPKITGRADLTAGRFDDYPTGLKLRDATLGAALNTDVIAVDKFSASDTQKGSISGSGEISLARGGASNLLLKATNFRLVDNDTAQADTTGNVTVVRGADGKVRITGALEVVKGEINAAAKTSPDIPTVEVVEKNRPFNLQEQLQSPPAAQPGIGLDVSLTAPRGILVKGRGLNLDMSLDAKVSGASDKPILSGEAKVVRGDYEFGGQRFTFDDRGTVTLSNDPRFIRLNLIATRDDPNLTAVITISGTAAKPQIDLSSTPTLPKDEILSQVLFGTSAAQLSPLQAAQLASALTALASGGGFDVIGGIRSFARLDRLALVGGGTEGVSVAGGKYIGDKFYVEVAGGGREGPSAEVEYYITHNLSLASKLANVQPAATTNTTPGTVVQTGSSISIRWHRDFRDPQPKAPKPASPAQVAPNKPGQ